ncbi:hypothetical protein BJY01DRAFT_221277 [Aspergillus pseudoustus]|uniref:Uncharacterized protein n=1 Tax=Aspergillus pseudoustus TaxID=1810923 RepID=A0ABR4JAV7_9EURO
MVTGGAEPIISTYTFGGEDSVPTADLVAYATHTPIVVVYRAEDLDEEEDDDGGDNGDDSQEDENSNQDEDAEDPTPTGAAARIDGGGFGVSWGGAAALVASAVVGASMVLFT